MPTEMEPSENSIQLTGFGALDKVGLKEKSLWVLNIYIIYTWTLQGCQISAPTSVFWCSDPCRVQVYIYTRVAFRIHDY